TPPQRLCAPARGHLSPPQATAVPAAGLPGSGAAASAGGAAAALPRAGSVRSTAESEPVGPEPRTVAAADSVQLTGRKRDGLARGATFRVSRGPALLCVPG